MKGQTAVEWLFLMLNNPNKDQEFANKLLQQAKEMEKEQIVNAFEDGQSELSLKDKHDYYNETYGGKKCHETK
jgi:hypothetical protein